MFFASIMPTVPAASQDRYDEYGAFPEVYRKLNGIGNSAVIVKGGRIAAAGKVLELFAG